MPACLSQITMRNFWEKPWPCDGKYPIDFTRIGFHPIKRALARFTGMLCLPHAALVTTSSCKLVFLLCAAAATSPPGRRTGTQKQGLWQHPMALSHCWQLRLLSPQPFSWSKRRKQHPSVITKKFTRVPGVSILPFRQFYSSHQGLSRSWGS